MALWLKALHIMAVISWMAGLLYLPRLFVYHADSVKGSEKSETFKTMERRLLKVIMSPAMMVAWVCGLAIAYLQNQFMDAWFLVKFALVIGLTGFHIYLSRLQKAFAADTCTKSASFFRKINEIPTVLMIFIVILVVLKPF